MKLVPPVLTLMLVALWLLLNNTLASGHILFAVVLAIASGFVCRKTLPACVPATMSIAHPPPFFACTTHSQAGSGPLALHFTVSSPVEPSLVDTFGRVGGCESSQGNAGVKAGCP